MTTRITLTLIACAGCPANLPIDGATDTSVSGEQSGDHSGTSTTEPTTGAAVCVPPTGAPGEVLVTVPVTGMGNQHVRAVAVDGAGDTYIAGFFNDTLELQDASAGDESTSSAFVARLDCAGELVWLTAARAADAGASSQGHAIVVHGERVYLGGELVGSMQFTDGPALQGGAGRAFIAGFDVADGAPGDFMLLAEETAAVRGLAIDGPGNNIYAAGGCDGDGKGVLIARWTGQAEPGAYACEYTMQPMVTTALSVALDPDGGLVLGGQLSAAVVGWTGPAISAGNSRGFVARFDPPLDLTGPVAPTWLATLGDDDFMENRVNAVALRAGEVVAAARGFGLTQLQGPSDTACGSECEQTTGNDVHRTAVVRLGDGGACLGASVLCSDTESSEEVWGLAVTADRTYVTGQFSGSLLLGGQDLTTAPRPASVRTFVMNLDAALSRDADAWVLLSDDAEDMECGFVSDKPGATPEPLSIVRGATIAAGPDGLVVAGSVCGPGLSLGGDPFMPGPQSYDGFVAKLAR